MQSIFGSKIQVTQGRSDVFRSSIQVTQRRDASIFSSLIQVTQHQTKSVYARIRVNRNDYQTIIGSKIQVTQHRALDIYSQVTISINEARIPQSILEKHHIITPDSPDPEQSDAEIEIVFPGSVQVFDYSAVLLDGDSFIKLRDFSISETVNQGVDWQANPRDEIDLAMIEETPFKLRITKGRSQYDSPIILAAGQPRTRRESVEGGITYSLGGIDATIWRLTRDDISFSTFLDSNQGAVFGAIGNYLNIGITGAPGLPFQEEDIKNSKGLDVISRHLAIAGFNFYVTSSGLMCFPVDIEGDLNDAYYCRSWDTSVNMSARVDYITIEKTSRTSGGGSNEFCFRFDNPGVHTVQFPYPLNNPVPYDKSANAKVRSVSIFHGEPKFSNFQQTYFFGGVDPAVNTQTLTGGAGKVSNSAVIRIDENEPLFPDFQFDGKVCFSGHPLTTGIFKLEDLAYRLYLGTVSNTSRPSPSPWTETLWPKKDQIIGIAPRLLIEKNKGYKTLAASGSPQLGVRLTQRVARNNESYRIESFTHTGNPNDVQTSISGFIPWHPTVNVATQLPPSTPPSKIRW